MIRYNDMTKKKAVSELRTGKFTRREIASKYGCSTAILDIWLKDSRYSEITSKANTSCDIVTEEPTSAINAALAELCAELLRNGQYASVRKALEAFN